MMTSPVRFALILGVLLGGLLAQAADGPALPPGVQTQFKGHKDQVFGIAFSPDGKVVVTGSLDRTIKLWDAGTGKEIKTLAGHNDQVLAVAVSPNGQLLASGSSDRTVKLWSMPSDDPTHVFAHADEVNALALSPDGKLLAGAAKDGTITLWNPADGKQLAQLKGHGGAVRSLAFNVTSKILASTGADGTLRFWELPGGKPLGSVLAGDVPLNSVAWDAGSKTAFTASDDSTIKAWQFPPPPPRKLPDHADGVTALALAAGGTQILSGSSDKTVRICTFAKGEQVRQLTGPAAPILAVAASPDSKTVVAGTADQRLVVWNAADGKLLSQEVVHGGPVTGVAFQPQGNQLLTASKDGLVKLWAWPQIPAQVMTHADQVRCAVAGPDGKLFTGSNDKIARAWNIKNGQAEKQFSGHVGPVTAIAVTGQVLATGSDDATIRLWNTATGQQTGVAGAHEGPLTSLVFLSSGHLVSTSVDGTVKLWQNPMMPRLLNHPDAVTAVVAGNEAGKLITVCKDKQVRVWNLGNGQVERTIPGQVAVQSPDASTIAVADGQTLKLATSKEGQAEPKTISLAAEIRCLAYSPDGKTLAAGLADNSIRLIDVGQFKEIRTLAGHGGAITALTFTPKGDLLISSSADQTAIIWNPVDGSSKVKINHGAVIHCLSLTADGVRLATGGADKAVKLWNLADGKALTAVTTPAEVRGVSFHPDGQRILAAGVDNLARIYGSDGKLAEFFPHEGPLAGGLFLPGGKLVATASADKNVRVWTPSLTWQSRHAGPVRQAIGTPKGDQVIAAGDDKAIWIWNAADGKEVKTLAGHEGAITGLGITADGQRLVSASADKTVKIWKLDADKPIASHVLPGPARSLAVSSDGRKLAVALAEEGKYPIRVLDMETGKELMTAASHTAPIVALAFDRDNRTLLSASEDKTARTTDVNILGIIEAHRDGVTGVKFDKNGTQALTAGQDKTVKLWDLPAAKVLQTWTMADPVTAIAFSGDFNQVGAAAGKTVKIWNRADGKEVRGLDHPAPVLALAFSTDNTKLVTGSADKRCRVWDLATGKLLQVINRGGPIQAVLLHPDNQSVIMGSDKTVRVQPLAVTRLHVMKSPVRQLSFVPESSRLLSAADDGTIQFWSQGLGKIERTVPVSKEPVSAFAMAKNGVLLAAGSGSTVRLFTVYNGKESIVLKTAAPVRSVAFSPNNQMLAAACADNRILVWDVNQPAPATFGKLLRTLTHSAPATGLAWAGDGNTLFSNSLDKTIKAWQFGSGGPGKNIGHPDIVHAVAFDPAGTRLATGCKDGNLRIIDVAKAQVIKQITAHNKPQPAAIYGVAWTPDGKQVATASLDHSLKLWDPGSGNLVREFKPYNPKDFDKGHRRAVYALAFSPDGQVLASAGDDRTLKLWSVAEGKVVREFANPKWAKPAAPMAEPGKPALPAQPPQAHPGWIYGLRFTPDGKFLISAGSAPNYHGYLAIWNTGDGALVHSQDVATGAINAIALAADGKTLAIGCGATARRDQASIAAILKMPELTK